MYDVSKGRRAPLEMDSLGIFDGIAHVVAEDAVLAVNYGDSTLRWQRRLKLALPFYTSHSN